MSELSEKVKLLTGNRRMFLLMRIAGLDPDVSRNLLGVTQGMYNTWLKNESFVELHRQIPELMGDHRHDAVRMLRKENQLEAVLLEGKIISKIKEELDNGDYKLIRTHLAREVYSKLMSDLDIVPDVKVLSWEKRVSHFLQSPQPQPQLQEGALDGEFEEVGIKQAEHSQGIIIQEVQPTHNEAQETA